MYPPKLHTVLSIDATSIKKNQSYSFGMKYGEMVSCGFHIFMPSFPSKDKKTKGEQQPR